MIARAPMIAALALLAGTAAARADIIVPGDYAAKPGDQANIAPFDIGPTQQRLQQLYSSAAFGTAPITLYGLAFRPAAFGAKAFSATLPAIKISLSTSPRKVGVGDDISFADYIGADVKTVVDGALKLRSGYVAAAGGTRAFDVIVRFTTPFLYDPSKGDLLVDILNTGGGTTTPFDLVTLGSPLIDQLYTYRGAEPYTLPTGHARPGGGLITDFLTTPVPESGTLALLGTGIVVIGAARRRRQALASNRHC